MPSKAKIFSRLAQNVDLVGGVIKIDTVSLTNASMDANTQMAGVNLSNQTVPVGTIQSHSANTAPSGWLICDGSAISRTTYSDLYSIVGTTWGSGDGSTTFAIPDLRGWFMRGLNGGSGNDPDAASRSGGDNVGSSQGYQLSAHTHGVSTGRLYVAPQYYYHMVNTVTINAAQSISTESRPRNKYVQFCIKY